MFRVKWSSQFQIIRLVRIFPQQVKSDRKLFESLIQVMANWFQLHESVICIGLTWGILSSSRTLII